MILMMYCLFIVCVNLKDFIIFIVFNLNLVKNLKWFLFADAYEYITVELDKPDGVSLGLSIVGRR